MLSSVSVNIKLGCKVFVVMMVHGARHWNLDVFVNGNATNDVLGHDLENLDQT